MMMKTKTETRNLIYHFRRPHIAALASRSYSRPSIHPSSAVISCDDGRDVCSKRKQPRIVTEPLHHSFLEHWSTLE
jgi:hypothetical protein